MLLPPERGQLLYSATLFGASSGDWIKVAQAKSVVVAAVEYPLVIAGSWPLRPPEWAVSSFPFPSDLAVGWKSVAHSSPWRCREDHWVGPHTIVIPTSTKTLSGNDYSVWVACWPPIVPAELALTITKFNNWAAAAATSPISGSSTYLQQASCVNDIRSFLCTWLFILNCLGQIL